MDELEKVAKEANAYGAYQRVQKELEKFRMRVINNDQTAEVEELEQLFLADFPQQGGTVTRIMDECRVLKRSMEEKYAFLSLLNN